MGDDSPVVVPLRKILFDIFLAIGVGSFYLWLYLWVPVFHRGFFCEDTSIRHPIKPSTMKYMYILITGFVVNTLLVILTEFVCRKRCARDALVCGKRVPGWMLSAFNVVLVYGFGLACSEVASCTMKHAIGRLRPHFYTACLPNVNCSAPGNRFKYHVNFKCTNKKYMHDKFVLTDIRKSFPSGHASYVTYGSVFIAVYLQQRMTWEGSKLLKHVLQFGALDYAVYNAMSRISNYKHHWSDVLFGAILGFAVACVVTRYVLVLCDKNKDLEGVDTTDKE